MTSENTPLRKQGRSRNLMRQGCGGLPNKLSCPSPGKSSPKKVAAKLFILQGAVPDTILHSCLGEAQLIVSRNVAFGDDPQKPVAENGVIRRNLVQVGVAAQFRVRRHPTAIRGMAPAESPVNTSRRIGSHGQHSAPPSSSEPLRAPPACARMSRRVARQQGEIACNLWV